MERKMTTNNKPAQTFYQIQNNWDDRLLCKNNITWVNDGRESTVFETLTEAENVAHDIIDEKLFSKGETK